MEVKKERKEIVVVSDIHLGTYGCRAKELLAYLKSVETDTLILNGDIIDIWQFSKNYFPKSHMKVLRYILKLAMNGTKIIYITGNHDEMLRKFSGMNFGNISIVNQHEVDLNGHRTLFFHGDVFDFSIKHAKWLAKLGGKGYDLLIHLNTMINYISEKFGGKRVSLSKAIKNSVKKAVKFIGNFELSAAEYAAYRACDVVVCGHIHQAADRIQMLNDKTVRYLNSGDWVENLTALEYMAGEWSLVHYTAEKASEVQDEPEEIHIEQLLREFSLV